MSSRDWYSALRPVTRFSQIIGIFPLSLKGPVGGRKFTPTYGTLMYSLIVFLSMKISLLVSMAEALTKFQNLDLFGATLQFGLFLQVLSMVVFFASTVFARGKMANIINSLCAQDEALRNLRIRLDYAADFRHRCIRLGVIVSICLVLWTLDFVLRFETNLRQLFFWMVWMLNHLTRVSGTCLFMEIILYSKQKFTVLNEYLLKMIQDSEDSALQTRSVRFRTCAQLRSIVTIHGNLCEYTLKWNQIFSLNMVIRFVYALLFLTFSLYYIVKEITDPKIDYYQIAGSVNWLLIVTVETVYVVLVCDMAKNEASQTGKLIHKLTVYEVDTALNIAIQNSSLQLHHDKLVFSVAGLFQLDWSLIQSIVGAVTTYLVILIQYNTAEQ